MQAELRLLERRRDSADALEAVAAILRLKEPALIYLQCGDRVWPVTLFPEQMVYHSPCSLLLATRRELSLLQTLEIEPPGVRPPGHWMHDRVAAGESYHPLTPALWRLALDGPRADLLHEIAGAATYRALRDPATQSLPTPGALGPTIKRMREQSAPLRRISALPGMSEERAARLVNALYLSSNLIASRAHPSADPGVMSWLFSRRAR
ncbi:MAG: hypothetical protein OEU94_13165 [Aquincola sp.]|nr:hypothetical protein [Aquincola sp.]MDH4288350.1 hypothetical protein [Aquincola sp.]MDH5329182.1 hypothetical protein [Aquincola sp.]